MGKPTGANRLLQPYKGTPQSNASLFNTAIGLSQFDRQLSFIVPETGAFVLYGAGHNYHAEEIEIARGFAQNGINVILTSEQNMMLARQWVYNQKQKTLTPRFAEGTANGIIYEQKTTNFNTTNFIGNVINAINHANAAKADIAVIYDRYGVLHSHQIEAGMDKFQETHSHPKIKAVVVFDKNLNMYEHHWNK